MHNLAHLSKSIHPGICVLSVARLSPQRRNCIFHALLASPWHLRLRSGSKPFLHNKRRVYPGTLLAPAQTRVANGIPTWQAVSTGLEKSGVQHRIFFQQMQSWEAVKHMTHCSCSALWPDISMTGWGRPIMPLTDGLTDVRVVETLACTSDL